MTQTTLMGTPVEEKGGVTEAPEPVNKQRFSEQNNLVELENKELQQFVAEMQEQNEGCCYHHVKAVIEPQIDGSRKLYIDVEYTKEMPDKLLGGAWGQGGDFDLSAPEKWFNAVYDEKAQDIRMPYKDFRNCLSQKVEHNEEYYFYRLIRAKNYRVFIDEPILEALKGKFDLQGWLQKYQALAGKAATPEYEAKVQQIMDLLQHGDNLSRHDGSIAQIKQTIMARLGMNSAFLAKPHVWPEYAHLSVEQLHQELGAKRVELKEINQKIQELETSIGMARFDRFEEFG